jgi:hypothetical protein
MLDPYSLKVREALLARFPEWLPYCREEPEPSGQSSLVVNVPAPLESSATYGLCITTEQEEITVGFDHYHAHYGTFEPSGDPVEPDALSFIEGLLSDRIAVVSWWQGERWLGSTQLADGEPLKPPGPSEIPSDAQARVRSWWGTQNHRSRT